MLIIKTAVSHCVTISKAPVNNIWCYRDDPRKSLQWRKKLKTYYTRSLIKFVSPNVDMRECEICFHWLWKCNKFSLHVVADYWQHFNTPHVWSKSFTEIVPTFSILLKDRSIISRVVLLFSMTAKYTIPSWVILLQPTSR